MKFGEQGYSVLEMVVACAIATALAVVTAMAVFQTSRSTSISNSYVTAVRQVQNAGEWLSHDAQLAESVVVDNLEYPNFLVLSWTERNYHGGDSIYHTVTYFFNDLTQNVGKLKRNHWSSGGASEQTTVATHIYYNLADSDNTSKASYQNPVLTVRLKAIFGDAKETKEYIIERRTGF